MDNGEIDTSYWRSAEWYHLSFLESMNDVRNDLEKAEIRVENNGVVDNLFMNDAARRAFFELRGYATSGLNKPNTDSSILTVTRADACMSTMLKCITLGGKGGSRNDEFVQSFKKLLPKALASIIKEVWSDLEQIANHELTLYIGNSREHSNDPYGNALREWTAVITSPDDNRLYILAKPKYFEEKVCAWLGEIKDGQIGCYDESKGNFQMIDETSKFTLREDSDLDELTPNINVEVVSDDTL